MILVEETQVPDAALPVEMLKHHLRLGSGFATDDVQDPVLVSFLRAALAAVEARCAKALIARGFVLTVTAWRAPDAQALPVAPVTEITSVAMIDSFGVASVVTPDRYRLEQDALAPCLRARGTALPAMATGGSAEIRFTAGFAAEFDGIPADLQQAVMLLAAHYYEYRDETALGDGCMPFGVTALISRYRPVRVGLSG